jgi:hypothetical protein
MLMTRSARGRIVLAVVVAGVVGLTLLSQSFQTCIYANTHDYQDKPLQKDYWSIIRMWGWCFTGALREYAEVLGAVATIAIALFTLALRESTDRLWEAGERQIGALRKATLVSIHSAKAARKQAEVARDEFNATHRPQLDIGLVVMGTPTPGEPIHLRWTVTNLGTQKARIAESNATLIFSVEPLPAIPCYSDDRSFMNGNGIWIAPGYARSFNKKFTKDPADWTLFELSKRDKLVQSIFFIGYLLYEGPDNLRRSVAFCRRYNVASERFDAVRDPNYEHRA